MKNKFPAFAKRALAFALALALMLSLVPALSLTANAAHSGTWTYKSSYDWINGSFEATDADQVYQDSDAYDWKVIIFPTKSPPASAQVVASITDASGKVISSYRTIVSGMAQRVETELCSYENFPELTTSLYGTFTLTCELLLSGTTYAKLVQTFSRVSSSPVTSTVTSRSNPDNVFTFADPIDLVLNIKKIDGVAAAYNAAITVTDNSGTTSLSKGLSLPASTNTTLILKDHLNITSIRTAGAYQVGLTLTDSTGEIKHRTSFPFYVVALAGNLDAFITSEISPNFTFNNTVPDLMVNLDKTDDVVETLTTVVTVKDSSGTSQYSNTFKTADAVATITPDLSGLPTTGTFTMTAVVTDDAGNQRATTSVTFTRTRVNVTPATYSITSAPKSVTGSIYSNSGISDFTMSIKIINQSIKGQKVYIKAEGTLNGKPFVSPALEKTLSAYSGSVTTAFNGKNLGSYGLFENISLAVYDGGGNLLCKTTEAYSFARVLDNSTPGSLPILNINDHFTSGKGDSDKKLTLAAQTGANMWRSTIPWASVEDTKGFYEMPGSVETVLDKTKAMGMKTLIILAYGNDSLYGTPNPNNSTWLQGYVDYCTFVATYMRDNYPGQVYAFEIWNEWNHATMSKVPATYRTGANYAKVVVAASAAIKKILPNAKIIGGATAGDGYGNSSSNTFIKAMLAYNGFIDAVDGISFHTYSSMETSPDGSNPRIFKYVSPAAHDFAARIHNFSNLMNQYGASGKEIWITETGWSTNSEPEYSTGTTDGGKTHITYGADEKDAAAYLVQLYTWALADGTVDRIFWYDFMNDISNQTKIWANNQTESNYGLIHNWNNSGDQPEAYSAKAGYATMCALSSMMSGTSNGKRLDLGEGIFAYQFNKGTGYITVAWTDGANKTVTANLANSITVSDMYGNPTTYSGNSVVLELSQDPIYIEYASGAITSFG